MRLRLFVVVLVCLLLFVPGAVQGGVVTSLLGAMNSADDTLQDKSVGFLIDATGGGGSPTVGDVGWGLIRVDTVNGTSAGVADHVFMVYSAEISDITGSVVSHKPTSGTTWTLSAITGLSSIDSKAVVLLFETTSPEFTGINFSTFPTMAPATLKSSISSLFSTPGAVSPIAAFGLDTGDYLKLTLFSPTFASQEARLSILNSYVGPLSDWKELFSAPGYEAGVGFSDSASTISYSAGTFPTEGYIKAQDSGTYRVNYVPEPASLAGVAGAGLTGLGLSWFRRRKRS